MAFNFIFRDSKSQRGFTLVELSIVLVVIGLLIGGVLAAQSMINASKIQRTVRDIDQYRVAIGNFVTKYNSLPGDTTLFGLTAVHADNRIIGNGLTEKYEMDVFWSELSQGVGLMNANGTAYTSFYDTGVPVKGQAPTFVLDQYSTDTAPALLLPHQSNRVQYMWYVNYDCGNAPLNCVNYAPLKPVDVLALDKKMDDGIGGSGWFSAYNSGAGTSCFVAGTWAYNVNSDNSRCLLIMAWDNLMAGSY